MDIFLSDNLNTGHHDIYQKKLNEIDNTYIKNELISFTSIKNDYRKALNDRKLFLNNISSEATENTLIHLLYIDSIYKCPFISNKLDNRKIQYVGTLHWVPKSIINQFMLKKFCKKLECVIVHSEYLKKEMNDIGIKNVKSIDYPSFMKRTNRLNNNEKIVISCLGGTRSDKGLDILLESFKYIENHKKDKVIFNIAGIEQDIKFDDIINTAKQYKINIIIQNKFLTTSEYENEIIKSDVILLPYKKIFAGNSGPMTDGIYMNKFILAPDEGNLGFLVKKHDLGLTFKQEDPIDLAHKIGELTNISLEKNHEYRNEITVHQFIEKYKELYKDIEERRHK